MYFHAKSLIQRILKVLAWMANGTSRTGIPKECGPSYTKRGMLNTENESTWKNCKQLSYCEVLCLVITKTYVCPTQLSSSSSNAVLQKYIMHAVFLYWLHSRVPLYTVCTCRTMLRDPPLEILHSFLASFQIDVSKYIIYCPIEHPGLHKSSLFVRYYTT